MFHIVSTSPYTWFVPRVSVARWGCHLSGAMSALHRAGEWQKCIASWDCTGSEPMLNRVWRRFIRIFFRFRSWGLIGYMGPHQMLKSLFVLLFIYVQMCRDSLGWLAHTDLTSRFLSLWRRVFPWCSSSGSLTLLTLIATREVSDYLYDSIC